MSTNTPLRKILSQKSFLAELKAEKKTASPDDVAKIDKILNDFEEVESAIYELPVMLKNKASAGIREYKVLTVTGMDTRAVMRLREWLMLQQLDIEYRPEADQIMEAIWVVW